MPLQTLLILEAFVANVALERFLLLMRCLFMLLEFFRAEEFAVAALATVACLISVDLLMALEQIQSRELLLTDCARIRFLLRMRYHMFSEIVFGEELTFTLCTFVIAVTMSALYM